MKKIFNISIISILFSANLSATAILCNADGSWCAEVTQLNMGGAGWQNACCHHIPYSGSCEDDCTPPALAATAPGPHVGFNYVAVPSNFSTQSGNNVWIFDADSHLPGVFSSGDLEYDGVNKLHDYDFLGISSNLEFILIQLSETRFAVVRKLSETLERKKSLGPISFVEGSEINIFPNPISLGQSINFQGLNEIQNANIYDVNGRLIQELNITGEKFVYHIPLTFNTGVYFVRFFQDEENYFTKKVIVK